MHVGTGTPRPRPATQAELLGGGGHGGKLRPFAGVQAPLGGMGHVGLARTVSSFLTCEQPPIPARLLGIQGDAEGGVRRWRERPGL